LRSCHSQVTWIRRTFPAPRNLSLEGHVRSKLIIIIIIIIIDFALQIKFIFFYNNIFFFKFNNIYDINYNKNNKIYNKNKNIYNTNNNIKSCARAAMCWL
jgi:hypothetical protein